MASEIVRTPPDKGASSSNLGAGRVCCGVELDPLYVDVIIRRYEASTGIAAILADSGAPQPIWGCGSG